MPVRGRVDIRQKARLAVLLTLALCLHVAESWMGALFPVPGARLGLANLVTLIVLGCYGLREALVLVTARQVASSLFGGTLLGTGFWIGLGAGTLAGMVMWAAITYGSRWLSPVGVSILGAAAHNTGQLLVASVFIGNYSVFTWLPYLLFISIITGSFTGLAAVFLARALNRVTESGLPGWKLLLADPGSGTLQERLPDLAGTAN